MNMNLFAFMVTRQLVVNKTGDPQRANRLGLLTSMVPGPWGMMLGMVVANREPAPQWDVGVDDKGDPLPPRRPIASGSQPPTLR